MIEIFSEQYARSVVRAWSRARRRVTAVPDGFALSEEYTLPLSSQELDLALAGNTVDVEVTQA